MTTPAANIAEAIQYAADNIAELSYDAVASLFTLMSDWNTDMFGTAGVFPPANVANDGQRRVIDWRGLSNRAQRNIEGPAAGDAGVFGTSGVIDAVIRVLYAVRDATAAGAATSAQQTATVTAFNANWT